MINLSKGEGRVLNLAKVNQELKVGLRWDENRAGDNIDLDVWVVPMKAGDLAEEEGIVYYNNKSSYNDAIVHSGDNRTGAGDGDDESITFKLANVPAHIERCRIIINIHSPATAKFGVVRNAKVVVYGGSEDGQDLVYDLEEDYSAFKTLIVAEVYRNNGGWKVRALSEGYSDGISQLLTAYGVANSG